MVDMLRSLQTRTILTLSSVGDREDGQAMTEYAILLFLITVVSLAVLTVLGHRVSSLFNEIIVDI
jgi:Flp pilus assembly pilin Flp